MASDSETKEKNVAGGSGQSSSKKSGSNNSNNFTQHKREYEEARQHAAASAERRHKSMSWTGRILVFFVVPSCAGCFGLLMSYLDKRAKAKEATGGSSALEFKLDLDQDFIYPFVLTLAVVLAVGFHSSGFSNTDGKGSPLLAWPKVRRKKKIIRKTIVVDEDGNPISETITNATDNDATHAKKD
jgi:hypothetical protein